MLWPNGSKTKPNVSSSFGKRKAPTAGASTNHRGTDFTGFAAVRAIAAGTIARVGTPAGWSAGGNQVWVQHDGFLSRYLHLKTGTTVVKAGQKVAEGQTLGTMGMTGTASGVNCHLEIVVGGVQIDPVPFIAARLGGTAGVKPKPPRNPRPTIRRGARGTAIALLQRTLKASYPLYASKLNVDSIFGPATERVVREFQRRAGLVVDGIVGPKTWAKLGL